LPNASQIELTNGWTFPNGGVLVQTFTLPVGRGNGSRRIETRLLTRQQGQWVGYSYRWNEDQSDATLVGAKGEDAEFTVRDSNRSGAKRKQTWHYPSRVECMACHGRAANFVLGFTAAQLNRTRDYAGVRDNQLRALHHAGVFNGNKPSPPKTALVDPYDTNEALEARARSYLHVNCSVCHVEAGGGNAKMELAIDAKPEKMNLVGAWPQHDSFGIASAMLVYPGDPERSILYQRLSRRGRGQMPPLVSTVVDDRAVALMRDWIAGMKPAQKFVHDWKLEDLLPALARIDHDRSFESGRKAFRETGCNQCHRFSGEGGSVGPDLTGVGRRLPPRELLESILLPSKSITEGYGTTEIETKSGDVVSGRIEREDEKMLMVRPPSSTDTPVSIRKTDILRRTISNTSNMPTGVVNTLDETEVLDLLAYLISDGNSEDAAFRSSASKQ